MKQVLSIEQMKHLQELGLDTSDASMVLLYTDDEGEIIEWDDADEFPEKFMQLHDAETGNYDHSYRNCYGVFTLQDILELLPKAISRNDLLFPLKIEYSTIKNVWAICYWNHGTIQNSLYDSENLLDAAYEMLRWVLTNKYIQ